MSKPDRGDPAQIETAPADLSSCCDPLPTSLRELVASSVPSTMDQSPASLNENSVAAAAAKAEPRPLSRGPAGRVQVRGKFFFVGDHKFYVRGVTYGPFPPGPDGCEYRDRNTVDRDFRMMAERGINAVRTYTVPPRWLLDAAAEHGLRVMVGVPWEQHVTFLDDRRIRRRIAEKVRESVRACAGHEAVLCYTVGNEIPANIVRWHGPTKIERFIKRLYRAAKAEDPGALVTYVSYPSTEYLQLPFLDFDCFNVYLEQQERLEGYLARLQNLSGERPLVMAEIGLDSLRNGEEQQAETLRWQIRSTFKAGCTGAFLFAWSDAWYRGGMEITDWAFGLTDRAGQPKPALEAVTDAFCNMLEPEGDSPLISVVICTYNGSRTIRETLEHVVDLQYDNYEVLVVNDGSTDATGSIVDQFNVRHIRISNGGLSNARNVGMREARGEIVAYIDDDAYPDPSWLNYLALSFQSTPHVGIGGPNLPPAEACTVADCVANSPGGPSHVLHTDTLAEHLPGCNMAFRKSAIEAIDGFDTRFTIAGDDVDLCWRLLENDGTLGFNAGALVWHHRRDSVKTYLKQQRNYGKAEAMLETKWPGRYNRLGHLRWAGHLYGRGHTRTLALGRPPILHGVWGQRLFQPMYAGAPGSVASLAIMPEWYLVSAGLGAFSLLGFLWAPLFLALPLFVLATALPLILACRSASEAEFARDRLRRWCLTMFLHVTQPMARLIGRMCGGLTPWRPHGVRSWCVPRSRVFSHWSETWRASTDWLEDLERSLRARRVLVRRGGVCHRWDLRATCGLLGKARLISTVEEHGQGKQQVRVRVWPRLSGLALVVIPILAGLSVAAGSDSAWVVCGGLAAAALLVMIRSYRECAAAVNSVRLSVNEWGKGERKVTGE